MLRLVALVTLVPDADVQEHVRLLREMAGNQDEVLTAEVGVCRPPMRGVDAPASYVYTATFADAESLQRYATGRAHDELAAEMEHEVVRTVTATFEADART
jgi:hypothetical protein